MTYLLACEVVTQNGSIACVADDGTELDFVGLGFRRFGQELVPGLQQCLQRYGRPRALAVAVGPGSFTGLRVAVIAMRTLAWLEDLPLHAVDSTAARAVQEGPGCWWVWQSLKRDTTFHACHRVDNDHLQTILPVSPCLDEQRPPQDAIPAEARVIGDALEVKVELKAHWALKRTCGSSAPLSARGVAAAARFFPANPWEQVLPAYHQASAPELQRQAKGSA
jgi:tRNA threonylcarbamoyl adenosine modification protein YeaZ